MTLRPLFFSLLAATALCADAKIVMPQLFQNGMVVQRGKPIAVWGMADKGETIAIAWQKRTYTTAADSTGRWHATLPPQKAGGPFTMSIRSNSSTAGNDIEIGDIMVGDVWLCGGQSNMDITIERVYPQYAAEIDSYSNEHIRLFRVQTDYDTHAPKPDVLPAQWQKLSKTKAWYFSAIGYFLAKRRYEETGVPQGVICNSVGGTPIEAWLSEDSLQNGFADDVARTRLYRDTLQVRLQQDADRLANQQWYMLLGERDSITPHSADHHWPVVSQYALPRFLQSRSAAGAQQPRTPFIGSLWLRQHIQLSKEQAAKGARLLLGTLYDQDFTFINGREVGRTYYQYPPRRYTVPAGVLHEGDNTLSVRLVNRWGVPHFLPSKPYMLLLDNGDTIRLSSEWKAQIGTHMPPFQQGGISMQNLPTVLYNAMLAPLAPYPIAGVVWYQGEANTDHAATYATLLRRMMGNWRALWGNGQLPFCIVQLANYDPQYQDQWGAKQAECEKERCDKPAPDDGWPLLREAQRQVAAADPHAELVVTIDVGETVDIHPLKKKEVAARVAQCFNRLVDGCKVALSPVVTQATQQGRSVTLTFDQELQAATAIAFDVEAADGRHLAATGHTAGRKTVVVDAPAEQIVKVRYAWRNDPQGSLLHSATGLPASPFEWPVK